MTSKGFFQAITGDESTPNVPRNEPENIPSSDRLAPPQSTWLSRLGVNHRRSSMGFSMGTSMHEHDEENSNSFNTMLSISKQTLGCDTPSNDITTGAFVEITEDGKFKLEGLQKTEIKEEIMNNETHLADVLGSAVCLNEFPVATKESLQQLEEMKLRLNTRTDEVQFDMDMDHEQNNPTILVESEPNSRKTSTEQKPQSKLLTNIMQSGFAQNWFFKNEDNTEEVKEEKFTKTAFMDVETENANFPFAMTSEAKAEKSGKAISEPKKKSFAGMLEQKQNREYRESNVFAPQNF